MCVCLYITLLFSAARVNRLKCVAVLIEKAIHLIGHVTGIVLQLCICVCGRVLLLLL